MGRALDKSETQEVRGTSVQRVDKARRIKTIGFETPKNCVGFATGSHEGRDPDCRPVRAFNFMHPYFWPSGLKGARDQILQRSFGFGNCCLATKDVSGGAISMPDRPPGSDWAEFKSTSHPQS